jgi:predicted enzyme related to lactoylglutathione lyase
MHTRDDPWPTGTPAWTDLMTPDRQAAQAFYGDLFGWEFLESGPEHGFYVQAHIDGRPVAGLGEGPADQPTATAAWTTYLAVDDVEAMTRRVTAAGGTALMPAIEIGDFGRMAVVADPAGAVFGLWEAGEHIGARLVNVPGAMCWNEALSGDFEASKAFYAEVFGFALQDLSGPEFEYVGLQIRARTVGGLGAIGTEMESVSSHWLTYFAVESADAVAARAVALGGRCSGARDSAYGRMAVITGPQGESFAVIEPAPSAQGPDTWAPDVAESSDARPAGPEPGGPV